MDIFKKESKPLSFKVLVPIVIVLIAGIVIIATLNKMRTKQQAVYIPPVIFDKADARRLFPQGGPFGISPPYWTPTEKEALAAQRKLPKYISNNSPEGGAPIADVTEYKQQYLGITSDGKKKVYINAFCKKHWSGDPSWRRNFELVFGGGNCYFHVLYDPETQSFSGFSVNEVR